MGYRSDVAFVIRERPLAASNNGVSLFVPDFLAIEDCFDKVIVEPGRDILYTASDVKWCSGYGVVDAVEEFLSLLDGDSYLFIRIGEELEDMESNGYYHDNEYDVGVVRYINVENDDQ